jgi:hypothetical protein
MCFKLGAECVDRAGPAFRECRRTKARRYAGAAATPELRQGRRFPANWVPCIPGMGHDGARCPTITRPIPGMYDGPGVAFWPVRRRAPNLKCTHFYAQLDATCDHGIGALDGRHVGRYGSSCRYSSHSSSVRLRLAMWQARSGQGASSIARTCAVSSNEPR